MKYALILADGMADYPVPALGGKTPLESAHKPMIDFLCKTAKTGLVKTVPDGFKPGSDVANLGALGYHAAECYTGRSPLEALSIGIDMKSDDVAVRTNLVTLGDEENFEDKTMVDYSAGEITSEEGRELFRYLNEKLGDERFAFYAGVSYRNCLIIGKGSTSMTLTPPHDISGRKIGDYLPKGDFSAELTDFIKRSYELLKDHPVNKKRVLSGKNPANSIWFWGQGTRPALQSFKERYGLSGGMVSAVDLLKGIAIGAGMDCAEVPGANGGLDTNYEGKAQAAVDALLKDGYDLAYLHIEAPDEMGHQGSAERKIQAIENIDRQVLGPLTRQLDDAGTPYRLLVLPDHPTPVRLRTHVAEPVPYLLYEDFSGATERNGDNQTEMLDSYNLPGWSASNYSISAGQGLRLHRYVGAAFGLKEEKPGRLDSPMLANLKDGLAVRLTVSFDIGGTTYKDRLGNELNSTYGFGTGTKSGAVEASSDIENIVIPYEAAGTGGSYTNLPLHKTVEIEATNDNRLSWRSMSNVPGYMIGTVYVYIDNIKVQIAPEEAEE